jgi:ABC-type uncharacterized transport system permease subunit
VSLSFALLIIFGFAIVPCLLIVPDVRVVFSAQNKDETHFAKNNYNMINQDKPTCILQATTPVFLPTPTAGGV